VGGHRNRFRRRDACARGHLTAAVIAARAFSPCHQRGRNPHQYQLAKPLRGYRS
jgi:hypothetical protein